MSSDDVTPETTRQVTESPRVEFPCGNCGADMSWDPEADALSCEYCGNVVQVPRGEGTIVERALEDAGDAARGLGLEVRVARCGNCGARVAYDTTSTAELCVYCGSPNVLTQEANRNAIRPESVVPLDVGREQVRESFQRWIRGLWFRPNELKKVQHREAVGVYVPFWTFDCRVHSSWSADAGYYYYVTRTRVVMVNGRPRARTEQVRKIRWVPAWGERDDAYDDHLVPASASMPHRLVAKLGDFDTSELVPYKPDYLAGWRAEEYQVDLDQGWKEGEAHVVATQERRCAGDVPGDTHRHLRVRNRIFDVRWKHVLLPIWSLQYRFRGKTFTVLVNGQSGRVAGEAPWSWVKIGLAVAALLAVAAVVVIVAAAAR